MSGLRECPECGALFYYEEDMQAHIASWHTPGGPYYLVCPKCWKKFESKASLIEHLRKHPEEEEATRERLEFYEEEEEEED
ncbi:MAG: C2H2-type zinc finger protein [Thermofilaceae archaeon]